MASGYRQRATVFNGRFASVIDAKCPSEAGVGSATGDSARIQEGRPVGRPCCTSYIALLE